MKTNSKFFFVISIILLSLNSVYPLEKQKISKELKNSISADHIKNRKSITLNIKFDYQETENFDNKKNENITFNHKEVLSQVFIKN